MASRKTLVSVQIVSIIVGVSVAAGAAPADDAARARLVARRDVAQKYYEKVRLVNEQRPGTISEENVQKASLEVFRAEYEMSKSPAEFLKAASSYLEQNGFTVTKRDK